MLQIQMPHCFVLRTARVILLLACSRQLVRAEVSPLPGAQNIPQLFTQSDSVCLGTVSDIQVVQQTTSGGNRPVQSIKHIATVQLKRVYKGEVPGSFTVTFTTQDPALVAMPNLEKAETAVLFLSRGNAGTLNFSDRHFGVFRMGGTITNTEGDGLIRLEHDAGQSLTGSAAEISEALAILLGYQKVDQMTEGLILASETQSSVDVGVQIEKLAVLMRTGKDSYYEQALNLLNTKLSGVNNVDLSILANRIQTAPSSVTLEVLDHFSMVPVFPIRLGALEAIRQRRAPESVPILVKHLSDENFLISYLAVITLSEIVQQGSGYNPSMPEFDKEPNLYLNRWKKWWDEFGRQRFPPVA